jgi:hypothetical protein
VRLEAYLHRAALREPFRIATGTSTESVTILVRVVVGELEGGGRRAPPAVS